MNRTTARRTGLVLAAFMICLACDSGPTEPGGNIAPEPITELPRSLSVAETQLISASNEFGFSLFEELQGADPSGNLFMSPLSVHMALGMVLNGAQNETLDAMRGILGFDGPGAPPSIEEINASYTELLALLAGLDPAVELEVANSIWYEPTFPFRTSYLDAVRQAFDAQIEGLDFASPATLAAINDWVSTKTNGRIPRMLDSIDPAEVMLLLNAIYFKGDWTTKFDAGRTANAPFYLADGTAKTVKMMVREPGDLMASRQAAFDLIDLPYGGAAFRMTIMLPAEEVSLDSRIEGLDAQTWQSWISSLQPSTVPVHLPRFRLEWEKELKEALESMGMGIAFVPGQADFGGMLAEGFDPQAPGTDLHITRVKQKSFVDVNEEGTEAAATTSVGIGVTSVTLPVVVDRPFLFAIRERLSGTVLFLGVVNDPPSS